ncbi:hypothetical protein [Cryobacterium sp. PAMC25264]|uniref:hypothetical protein n=1 Tax=Cryobacterium sp. PAMC25264 TaxID=2861288 RepID=UPI002103642D|nr:hypothetical protein [Cryobacterium sp. PAMC25264]
MTPTSASPARVRAHTDRALPARWRARYRLVPWWQKVIVIWLLSRPVTTTLVLALASVQGQNPWTPAKPGYTAFATMWDALWYNIVAVGGYPSVLPVTVDGHVGENAWAFMPGYPAVVRCSCSSPARPGRPWRLSCPLPAAWEPRCCSTA